VKGVSFFHACDYYLNNQQWKKPKKIEFPTFKNTNVPLIDSHFCFVYVDKSNRQASHDRM